jgi:cell wall-associated NlpC family hydrolase
MKNQFILLLTLINLAGCNAFRPASRTSDNLSDVSGDPNTEKNASPVFIRNISTEPAGSLNKPIEKSTETSSASYNSKKTTVPLFNNDGYGELQFKYAILTNTPVEQLTNKRLLEFLEQWYGVPYHYGGKSKEGIDCSAFVSLLLSNVYNVNQLPRISADQYRATQRVPKKDLKEGDLVFFHTLGKGHRVTHVGVYLYNNRFVHASIAGVQISDLGEGYYLYHYVGAGRVVGSDRTY